MSLAVGGAVVLTLGLLTTATSPAGAAAYILSNTSPITIPDSGDATPYPTTITVTGAGGSIVDINVKLASIGHAHPDDLDILIASPGGDSVVLMSDACGSTDFEDYDWTFDDEATGPMPDAPGGACNNLFYRPSNYDTSDTWPAGFDTPGSTLSRFDGENPNGAWLLYVRDDAAGDLGDIELGFSLEITTGPADLLLPGGNASTGPASSYPRIIAVSGQVGQIADVNVVFNGLSHEHPDDLDILLVGPQGHKVMLMSDACGSFNVTDYFWRWDDEASAVMSDEGSTNVCSAFNYRPTDHVVGDSMSAPAPVGPYGTTLSVFDKRKANGNWSIYVVDDAGGDSGYLINAPQLEITLAPQTTITVKPPGQTTSHRAKFRFTSSKPGSTFQCRLDDRPFRTCTSPKEYGSLATGVHVFRVRAIDTGGNIDPTPARWKWKVLR